MNKIGTLFIFIFMFLVSCSIPKDPRNSWDEIKSSSLKVGVIHNPPFTIYDRGKITGSEVQLLRQFALMNNITPIFIYGNESNLIKKIEAHQLHIIAGGLEEKTNWKKKVGLTMKHDSTHVFLIPKGENDLLYHLEKFIIEKKSK